MNLGHSGGGELRPARHGGPYFVDHLVGGRAITASLYARRAGRGAVQRAREDGLCAIRKAWPDGRKI